jgi:hypothetical protein
MIDPSVAIRLHGNRGSDLTKFRWRFSGNTSLTLGYIGIHGGYAETGGAFGSFLGQRTIVAAEPWAARNAALRSIRA